MGDDKCMRVERTDEIDAEAGSAGGSGGRCGGGSLRRADSVLSIRERDILGHTANGMSAGDVADYMRISKRTVEAHLVSVRDKLTARNTANAIAIALRRGIITSLSLAIMSHAMIGQSVVRVRRPNRAATARVAMQRLPRRDTGAEFA